MPHPPAYPHDPIEEIATDLFMVRRSIRMDALMRITRNMAIVRHQGELSLVNPIRLDEDGEQKLLALGGVKRILRLGPMHGLDDPYCVERFGAELWAQGELARLVMSFIGFPRTTVVGPTWLKMTTPEGGSLKSDFERLLSLDFDRLLSAHGSMLTSGAKDSVTAAVRRAFPDPRTRRRSQGSALTNAASVLIRAGRPMGRGRNPCAAPATA